MSKFEYGIKFGPGRDDVNPVTTKEQALRSSDGVRRWLSGRSWWVPIPELAASGNIKHDVLGQEIREGTYVASTLNKYADMRILQVIKLTPQRIKVINVATGVETVKSEYDVIVVDSRLIED